MNLMRVMTLRRSLLAAVSTSSILVCGAAAAQTANYGVTPEATLDIVANNTITPGPGAVNTGANFANSPQILHPAGSVTGVGQQIAFTQTGPAAGSLGLCTGSLINPRAVITAAHCVYGRPAHMYGSETGTGGGVNGPFGAGGATVTSQGVPISFGFGSTNRCLGVAVNGCAVGDGPYEQWRNSSFQTNEDLLIYNGNQVWYGTGSQPVALGGLGEFANQDIAIVTLDTHAQDIPTWTLLFSPLGEATHATITGYGGAGVGLSGIGNLAGIDYRRRSAENMIDALISSADWGMSAAIGGGAAQFGALTHTIYWMDFDDPNHDPENLPANFFVNVQPGPNPGRNNGYYDFNGLGGITLANEGTTAGGDSGGPLVVDQRWDRQVIAGVLTGSWSFNGGISTYGQFNVYPPLFQFWEEIVQNNPYVYASALAGNGNWFDPGHWVQDMDPNYVTIGADGELVNLLPDNPQGGADGAVARFGTTCFLETDCTIFSSPGQAPGDGIPHYTAGGPGTLNFVPNNVEPINSATPGQSVRARYYDVTLREAGTTTLSQTATIDAMTIDGNRSKLDIAAPGTLNVWADYNQMSGWTNVDGVLNTDEMLVVSGLLSGTGTINPDFLTVVAGIVAPSGADDLGTLTVNSDVILSSASALLIDAGRNGADRLAVSGVLDLNGGSVVFNKAPGAAPRHGQSFTIATAGLGVQGTFGSSYSFQGVLRPELTYNANSVVAELRAGSLTKMIGESGPVERAFAQALDQLRGNFYNSLYGLYGAIDLMDSQRLAATLSGLNPTIVGETKSLHDRQSKVLLNAITDRLSMLGSDSIGGSLSIVGQPHSLVALRSAGGIPAQAGLTSGLRPAETSFQRLPKGMSGFISGGFNANPASYGQMDGNSGQRSWHIGMGLEMEIAENATLGTAFGYSSGYSLPGVDRSRTDSRMTQAAIYGSYRFGGGGYVAGLAVAENSRAGIERQATTGEAMFDLAGATNASRYNLQAEAGVNIDVARGMTLTPRASLSYASYRFGGYRENGGELALQIDDLNIERLEARFGAKLAGSTSLAGGWSFVPQLQADYVRNLAGADDGMQVRFAVAPEQAFLLPLMGGDTSWAEVRGGMRLTNGPIELGAGLETSLGRSDYRDERAVADFTLRF